MGVSGDGFQRGAINGFSLAFEEIEKSDLDFSIFSRGLDKRRDEEGRWASYCSRPTDGKLLIIFRAFSTTLLQWSSLLSLRLADKS